MSVIDVTEETFETEVIKSKLPVLVDLWAPWCSPCKALAPVMERLAETYTDRLKVAKVNVEVHREIAVRFGVTALPTVLMVKDGVVTHQVNRVSVALLETLVRDLVQGK